MSTRLYRETRCIAGRRLLHGQSASKRRDASLSAPTVDHSRAQVAIEQVIWKILGTDISTKTQYHQASQSIGFIVMHGMADRGQKPRRFASQSIRASMEAQHSFAHNTEPSLLRFNGHLSVEHQGPHLDTLPILFVKLIRVRKSSMRRPTSRNRLVRVKALDQHDLVGRLPVLVEPSMAGVGQDGERLLAFPVLQQDGSGDEVGVRDRLAISYGQRIFMDRLDWTPDLEDGISGRFGEKRVRKPCSH